MTNEYQGGDYIAYQEEENQPYQEEYNQPYQPPVQQNQFRNQVDYPTPDRFRGFATEISASLFNDGVWDEHVMHSARNNTVKQLEKKIASARGDVVTAKNKLLIALKDVYDQQCKLKTLEAILAEKWEHEVIYYYPFYPNNSGRSIRCKRDLIKRLPSCKKSNKNTKKK